MPGGFDSQLASWVLGLRAESLPATPWALKASPTVPIGRSTFFGGPFVKVTDNARFLAWLRSDIHRGQEGPRSRTGALQEDMKALWLALTGLQEKT